MIGFVIGCYAATMSLTIGNVEKNSRESKNRKSVADIVAPTEMSTCVEEIMSIISALVSRAGGGCLSKTKCAKFRNWG